MLTPQEVSARSFTKAVMGGYNMTMVDEFLDELTEDYTSLYKENASLKAKMKVLVEKVEEYRATEDSMRATLLTAQKMADSLIKEAEEKRDNILQQAEAAAREKLDEYRKEAEECTKRLQMGQAETQRFIDESRHLCEEHLKFLEELPNHPLEGTEESATIEEIEQKVLAAEEPVAASAAVPQAPAAPSPAAQEPAAPAPAAAPQPTPEPRTTSESLLDALVAKEKEVESASTEDLSATRRVNINELKFGPNYRGGAN